VDVLAHFSFVHIESGHDFYVVRSEAPDFAMHQSDGVLKIFSFIEMDALNQRACTITDSDDGDSNFFHVAYDPSML